MDYVIRMNIVPDYMIARLNKMRAELLELEFGLEKAGPGKKRQAEILRAKISKIEHKFHCAAIKSAHAICA